MTVVDEAHVRMGKRRTFQIGLRMSESEWVLFERICNHRACNPREWIEYVLLLWAARIENASPAELASYQLAYSSWEPPKPATHFTNCRVFNTAAGMFDIAMRSLSVNDKFTSMLRWAVQFEAPIALREPSPIEVAQAKAREAAAQRHAAREARDAALRTQVQVPAGAAFVPGFDPHRPVTPQTVIVPEYSRGPQLVQQLAQALAKPSAPRPALFIPAPAAPAPTPAAPLRQLVLPPLPQEAVQTLQHNPPPYAAADEVPAFYRQKGPNDPTVPPMPDFSEEEY